MISAKLYILGEERELLWISTNYFKGTRADGSLTSEVNGGLLTLSFVTQENDELFLQNMTKKVKNETDRMEKGEIHFFENGFNDLPAKKYKFEDAYIIQFSEIFTTYETGRMETILTISPAIQDYGKQVIKPWQISWLPPSETAFYQTAKATEIKEEKIVDENPCDCTTAEKDKLQREVTNKCKGGIMKRCTDIDSCGSLVSKEAQFRECMNARIKINTKCFKGGDAGHKLQVQQAINGMINCQNLAILKCKPKEPIKLPVIDESLKEKISRLTGLTGTALIIYIILSEGSRLFPPRNLVPIP